jgi:hypothetical protein
MLEDKETEKFLILKKNFNKNLIRGFTKFISD